MEYNPILYCGTGISGMAILFKETKPRLFLIGHGEPICFNEEIEYLNDVIAHNGKVNELD